MTVNLTNFSFLDPGRAMREIEAAINDAIANKFADAPMDGTLYGRQNCAWQAASGLQGPAGPAGPMGAQGEQGPQGVVGPQGDPGPAGPQGLKGDVGPQGPQGPIGLTGPAGSAGTAGAQGPAGAAGPQGPKGDSGAQGAQGLIGPQGPQGNSGGVGAQGPAGPTGLTGATGVAGPVGPTGPAGPTAVSANAGNLAQLGTDNLLLVPDSAVHKGVTDGSNALAGNVGEQLAASQTTGVALTTNVTANIATLALTAGDWVVAGVVVFNPVQAPSALGAAVATASATLPTAAQIAAGTGNMTQYRLTFANGVTQTMQTGPTRISVAAPTTVYLMGQGTFNSTCTATGYVSARRVR